MKEKIIETREYVAVDGAVFSELDYGDYVVAREFCEKYEENLFNDLLEKSEEANKLKRTTQRLEADNRNLGILLSNAIDYIKTNVYCDWDKEDIKMSLNTEIGLEYEDMDKYLK